MSLTKGTLYLSIEKIADDLEEVVEVIRRIVIEIEAETN